MKASFLGDLESHGWQVLLSFTASWPVMRIGGDVFGDFRAAIKAMRLRAVLQRLLDQLIASKPDLRGARLTVVNHLPADTVDRVGAALLAAPESGSRLPAGVAQRVASEFLQALNALQSEAYERTTNLDMVDQFRKDQALRPAWMGKAEAIDASRAALVRSGRRNALWLRVRDGATTQFDVPHVPTTRPIDAGAICLEGSIIAINDRSRRVIVQGACKTSAVVKRLKLTTRVYNAQIHDQDVFARLRVLPPDRAISFDVQVAESIVHGGELQRHFLIVGFKVS